jgi:putative transport protein
MDFIMTLFTADTVAHSVLIFSLVAALGLLLGSIKIFGVKLGVAGVLFSGILFGHFGYSVNKEVLEFCREFGLILFVYTVGIQVGPGFFSSLKRDGLSLNLMAAFVVAAGAAIAVALSIFGNIPIAAAVGMFSGATTNTPSLGAAQQALGSIPGVSPETLKLPGLGYAVSYPFGILGIIITMIITRIIFRVNVSREVDAHAVVEAKKNAPLAVRNIRVDNVNLNGVAITNIPEIDVSGLVVSRVMHDNKVKVASAETKIYTGDVLYVVGIKERIDAFETVVGSRSDIDIRQVKSNIVAQRLIVTKPDIVGKTIGQLNIWERYGITVTRVSRTEVEFPVSPELQLHYADTLMAVGEEDDIKEFSEEIGNSLKELNHPFVIPLFVGIALGVLVGSCPISLPGIPSPVKLGLAGGPLLVAIILSRIGHIGKLIWYMPISANFMLRELGIVLFLACVGIKSGDQFFNIIFHGQGLYWMACATLITLVPILLIAIFARLKLKMNYLSICGILAGSMTDPPALAFANGLAPSSAPAVAYATVYPLVMLLRVIFAQLIVLYFVH